MYAGQDTVDMRSNPEAARWPLGVPIMDTAPNHALQAVLNELRRQRGAYMFLRVARRYAVYHDGLFLCLILVPLLDAVQSCCPMVQ